MSGRLCRIAAAPATAGLIPKYSCRRHQHTARPSMMGGRTPAVEQGGPDLGQRPHGPDPFFKVHGDMQRIKAKIKNIADRAMSSSSESSPADRLPVVGGRPAPGVRLAHSRRVTSSFSRRQEECGRNDGQQHQLVVQASREVVAAGCHYAAL